MFENPTLHSGTYLYSLYMGVPPPPPRENYLLSSHSMLHNYRKQSTTLFRGMGVGGWVVKVLVRAWGIKLVCYTRRLESKAPAKWSNIFCPTSCRKSMFDRSAASLNIAFKWFAMFDLDQTFSSNILLHQQIFDCLATSAKKASASGKKQPIRPGLMGNSLKQFRCWL